MDADMQKKVFLWGGIIVAVLAIMYGASALVVNTTGEDERGTPLSDPVQADEWIKGNPDAPVTIVEYSDFECPACRNEAPTLQALLNQYDGQVAIVYRHFPLTQAHKQAEAAAYAAEAAGKQGKFWEMHDQLFATQPEWTGNDEAATLFAGFAEELELDMEQYNADVAADEVKNAVQADVSSGSRSGVRSTPSFYLNGFKIRNPSLAGFQQLIDEALAETTADEENDDDGQEATESADYEEPAGAQDER